MPILFALPILACTEPSVRGTTDSVDVPSPLPTTEEPTAPVDPLSGIAEIDEPVAEGFVFTEGPTWRADDGVLLFTDIPTNRIHRLAPPSKVDVLIDDSGMANGLDTDVSGALLAAEHHNRRVSRRDAAGEVIDAVEQYDGKAFNSPNDLAVRSDGTLYFTDPPYGLAGRKRMIPFNGLFRLPAGSGEPVAEWEGDADATRPNGVVLSPDESRLYLADTQGDVSVFEVAGDGSLSDPQTFADDVEGADGMAVDVDGNLYVTAVDGIHVYAPDGAAWGVIDVPQQPANCAFGDADARTLYITARTALYAVRLARPGVY